MKKYYTIACDDNEVMRNRKKYVSLDAEPLMVLYTETFAPSEFVFLQMMYISKNGVEGGWVLQMQQEDIDVSEIMNLLEGAFQPLVKLYDIKDSKERLIHANALVKMMRSVMPAIDRPRPIFAMPKERDLLENEIPWKDLYHTLESGEKVGLSIPETGIHRINYRFRDGMVFFDKYSFSHLPYGDEVAFVKI